MRGIRTIYCAAIAAMLGIVAAGCSSSSSSPSASSSASTAKSGPTTLPTTVLIKAHQGAWIEQIDGQPYTAPKFALIDKGNQAVIAPGKHTLAIRTELDKNTSSGTNPGLTITVDTHQTGKLCTFELDMKPGHIYEIMSAGIQTGRLEVYDQTDRQLQYYDWGSQKLIANNTPEKQIQDYVAPTLAPKDAAIVKGSGGVNVITVDGAHVPGTNIQMGNFGGNTVVLTPGTHRIVARRAVSSMTFTSNDVSFEQEFKAGRTYKVGPKGFVGTAVKLEELKGN